MGSRTTAGITCILSLHVHEEKALINFTIQDERKLMGVKWLTAMAAVTAGSAYYKRFRWNLLKSRRISYK